MKNDIDKGEEHIIQLLREIKEHSITALCSRSVLLPSVSNE